jgi:transposase-like protein
MIQIGSTDAWLWIAIEPVNSSILGFYLSRHKRNTLIVESFLRSLVKNYGRHTLYLDGGTGYLEACYSLGIKHRCTDLLKKV